MSEKLPEAFVPVTKLEKFVRAGDAAGLTDYLACLSEAERLAERPGVRKLYKVMWDTRLSFHPAETARRTPIKDSQDNAINVAVYVCGSPEDMVKDWHAFLHHRSRLIELFRRIPRTDLQDFADLATTKGSATFPVVYALANSGMIEHPGHDNYVLGLLNLPVEQPPPREPDKRFPMLANMDQPLSIRGLLEENPEVMHALLLRLFEIEGNSDTSLSNRDKYGQGLGSARHTWHGLFLDLMQHGVFARALLLDKTLSALERDWPQYRSGWFSRFHETLEPSADEMQVHRARYLALCHSRNPPTVTLALSALQELHKLEAFSIDELNVALAPIMASRVKAQIVSVLKLLDAVTKTDAQAKRSAAMLAINALVCDASEVQKQVLQRLQRWDVDDEAKELLRQFLPLLAAAHKETALALLGNDAEAPRLQVPVVAAGALPQARPPLSPLDATRLLVPISTLDELQDRVAYALEHEADVDAFEQVVEALVRMEAEVAADAKRFGPVLKRARKMKNPKHLPGELARLVIAVLSEERVPPSRSFDKGHFGADAFLCRRIDELIEFIGHHAGLPPLAAPTHKLGYIDPAVLIERIAAEEEKGITSPRQEQVLSLLRLAPIGNAELIARARRLKQEPYVPALRYALGDDVKIGKEARLFAAAARIRHVAKDDPLLIERYGDCGPDTCHRASYRFYVEVSDSGDWTHRYGHIDIVPLRPEVPDPDFLASLRHPHFPETREVWGVIRNHFGVGEEGLVFTGAGILPSDLEAYFAEGARRLSNNLNWWEAEWCNRAYLSTLLDPTVEMSGMATLCLACGLAGKEPGQTALAVDALVCTWLEGRLHAATLAGILRQGLGDSIFKAARLHKSLQSASRMHEMGPYLIFELLCGVVCLDAEELPKDTPSLLELLLEVKLLSGRTMPEMTRSHVAAMRLSGKGKAAQARLLEA